MALEGSQQGVCRCQTGADLWQAGGHRVDDTCLDQDLQSDLQHDLQVLQSQVHRPCHMPEEENGQDSAAARDELDDSLPPCLSASAPELESMEVVAS